MEERIGLPAQADQELARARRIEGRITGPVRVLSYIASVWGIDSSALKVLLDYEDEQSVRDLLEGAISLRGRDREDRLRYIFIIHEALRQLFKDEREEAQWLREQIAELGQSSPLAIMLEGSMEAMLRVRYFVERMAGR